MMRRPLRFALATLAGLLLALPGCAADAPSSSLAPSPQAAKAPAPAATEAAPSQVAAEPPRASAERLERDRFRDRMRELSEPSAYFFSNNLISNETSYLQVADELAGRASTGAVYLGVGPEQNFSYIALTRPSRAFIVDIRRDNQLLLLLHRAAFVEGSSRAHYLALLLGRSFDAARSEPASADVGGVIERVLAERADEASFEAAHQALLHAIDGWELELSSEDRGALRKQHRAFFDGQLELRFELHHKNGRRYPTFGELLRARSPSGKHGSYLASADAYAFLRDLQRRGEVVPLVGDFAGDLALRQLGAHLRSEGAEVGVFYVSNVEQYLLEPAKWSAWVRNVGALPQRSDAVFVRAYLDQGRRHPAQLPGHRTATVLSPMRELPLRWGERPAPSLYALSTEGSLTRAPR